MSSSHPPLGPPTAKPPLYQNGDGNVVNVDPDEAWKRARLLTQKRNQDDYGEWKEPLESTPLDKAGQISGQGPTPPYAGFPLQRVLIENEYTNRPQEPPMPQYQASGGSSERSNGSYPTGAYKPPQPSFSHGALAGSPGWSESIPQRGQTQPQENTTPPTHKRGRRPSKRTLQPQDNGNPRTPRKTPFRESSQVRNLSSPDTQYDHSLTPGYGEQGLSPRYSRHETQVSSTARASDYQLQDYQPRDYQPRDHQLQSSDRVVGSRSATYPRLHDRASSHNLNNALAVAERPWDSPRHIQASAETGTLSETSTGSGTHDPVSMNSFAVNESPRELKGFGELMRDLYSAPAAPPSGVRTATSYQPGLDGPHSTIPPLPRAAANSGDRVQYTEERDRRLQLLATEVMPLMNVAKDSPGTDQPVVAIPKATYTTETTQAAAAKDPYSPPPICPRNEDKDSSDVDVDGQGGLKSELQLTRGRGQQGRTRTSSKRERGSGDSVRSLEPPSLTRSKIAMIDIPPVLIPASDDDSPENGRERDGKRVGK